MVQVNRKQRARNCVAVLTAIGLSERTAEALLWEALDQDHFAGLERMEICLVRWLDRQIADDPAAQALHEANGLIGRLLERLDLVTDALRAAHRREESVHPPRLLPSVRSRA